MGTENKDSEILFIEEQRLSQIWLWITVLFITGLAWYGMYHQIIMGEPFGTHPAPDWMMIVVWLVFGIGFPLIFITFKLKTEVRFEGVILKFSPVQKSQTFYPASNIKSAEAEDYRPLREYGGWGWRIGSKGKAYTVSGDRGVVLSFRDGSQVLIGSKKPDSLARAVQKIISD